MAVFLCAEMQKLRDALTEKDIEWADRSDEFPAICRTHFRIGRKRYSVINGYGTYGGYWERSPMNKGLLEVRRGKQEPKGYMTAEQVLEFCEIGGSASG